MKPAVQRVITALSTQGIVVAPREFAESTRTATDAATAIGTTIAQIVKSLIFLAGDAPVLVLASGANRVDTARLGAVCGAPISRATADRVREATGFAIGGVPPLGHATNLPTYIDRDLLAFDILWAAAGTPNAVFPVTPTDLCRITQGQVVTIAENVG